MLLFKEAKLYYSRQLREKIDIREDYVDEFVRLHWLNIFFIQNFLSQIIFLNQKKLGKTGCQIEIYEGCME
jgi:hypothetical protein